VTTNIDNLRKFYTINRETRKLLESMDAEAAKQIAQKTLNSAALNWRRSEISRLWCALEASEAQ